MFSCLFLVSRKDIYTYSYLLRLLEINHSELNFYVVLMLGSTANSSGVLNLVVDMI